MPRLRLLRLMVTNCDDMFASPPNTRLWSGKARLSTRITSAPWSRRSLPVSGPAMSCVNSRTRRPASGRLAGVRRAPRPRTAARRTATRPRRKCTAYGFGVGAGCWRGAAEPDALVVELEVARGQHALLSVDGRRGEGAAGAHRLAGDQLGRRQHGRDGHVALSAPRRRSPRSTCPRTAVRRSRPSRRDGSSGRRRSRARRRAARRDRRPTRAAPPIAGCSRPAGAPARRRSGTPGCPKPPVARRW